jgi:uncharacterized protein YgiM (DUF1202 family)
MTRRNYDQMYREMEREDFKNVEPVKVKEEEVKPVVEEKKPTVYVGTVTGGLNLNVRKQPNGEVVASLKDGEKVMIKDDSNPDWYKIDSPEGYVMKKFIKV